ncbi:MAG: fumarate reductase/succinate dehydrogenase flavoprotein subunit [Chloroflexi bacterium]|nr:fumarate reductase/succinate dehydrogenase flavoprotein subunit [Chloroflexota bacterium]
MNTPEPERLAYDVPVIGAGGAGLRAAIEASASGASVGVICKSLLGKAHTVMAEGGMAAALQNTDKRDSWQVHFRDTMRGGKHLNQWRMAQIHALEAPDRVRELEAWGAVFDRTDDGLILQRNFGGHRYPRLAHVGDRTGLEMIRTLQDHGVHQGLEVHMECTVTGLLVEGGRVVGALAFQRADGKLLAIAASAVVVATGGACRAWAINTNSWEGTGDGHALALDAGAELIDMEFVQFHPTGMVWPPSVRGILVTEAVRGEGGILRNRSGQRFMFDNVPEMFEGEFAEDESETRRWLEGDQQARRPPELLTRDEVARAILRQVGAGEGSPHGGVFLDIASQRSADDIRSRLPSMYHQFTELAQVDITKTPMEVGPTAHYIMGGIRVESESQASSLPGLFAAGEAAGGMHGANRLGGNSLTDLLVFGKRAGEHAAQYALECGSPPKPAAATVESAVARALSPFAAEGAENPFALLSELQEMMDRKVGIIRRQRDLESALGDLEELAARSASAPVRGGRAYNVAWQQAIDLRNVLTVARACALAGLARTESRGAHTRDDYPLTDPEWGDYSVIVGPSADGPLRVRRSRLEKPPPEFQAIIDGE